MSLFRHILVLFFIFATHQCAKPKESTHPAPEEDVATFSFSRSINALKLEISMKKDKCMNDKTKTLKRPEEENKPLGVTQDNAAESCNDVEDTGVYYIKSKMSGQAFKVKCNLDATTTCLIINSKIKESSIDSTAITKGDQIWLSLTDFDVELLYNKIEGITGTNRAQIAYLLSTSTSVSQTIRYYYSRGALTKKEDNKVASLKALSWNDHLVSIDITPQLPMQFQFSETESCWDGNSDWVCSNITFTDKSNKRLPVTDFYIGDELAKPGVLQKLYFDLVDLCFNYD